MTKIRFIGDVHGKFERYKKLIKKSPEGGSIQVGDLGVGFRRIATGEYTSNPPFDRMVENNARFIRGNHDNPEVCRNHKQWIPDGVREGSIFFCGGASSIDKEYRTEGYSWWPEEELSYQEFLKVQESYLNSKSKVVVTHDAPEEVISVLFPVHYKRKLEDGSRTRNAFQNMWEAYKPDVWIFGHWHENRDKEIMGTRFICLEELGSIDLEIKDD